MKRPIRTACAILAAVLLLGTFPTAALAAPATLDAADFLVDTGQGSAMLSVLRRGDAFFADVQTLADMADCGISRDAKTGTTSVYRPETSVILYRFADADAVTRSGTTYVPLEACARALGLRFQRRVGDGGFYVTAMKTPADLQRTLSDIFAKNCYHLWDVPLGSGFGWALGEAAARVWSSIPFVGSGSVVGAVTGSDEQERYDRAVASVLASSGSTLELIYAAVDLHGVFLDMGEKLASADNIISKIWEWIENNQALSRQLKDTGAYETVRAMFRTGSNPYEENVEDFLEGYPSVMKTIDIDYWIETLTFYGVAADAEEAMLLAMKKVFGDSSNARLRRSADKLFESQLGNTNESILVDIYGGYVFDRMFDALTDGMEDALYGENALSTAIYAQVVKKMVEALTDSPDIDGIADAVIYFRIFSTLALELSSYFYRHKNDETGHIGEDLRAVGILYLNTTRACAEKCRFDSELDDAIASIRQESDTDLAALLDYSEQEYDPAFVNAELLEYLESRLSSGTDLLPEVQPDVPASEAPAAETPVSSVMADGAYYAEFQSWTDAAATAELLVLTGASEASGNPSFSHTGEVLTFDTAGVDIYLEDIWNNGVEIHCQSVREAANTPVFGGDLTLAEASPMWAVLTVRGGAVTSVEFFYAA